MSSRHAALVFSGALALALLGCSSARMFVASSSDHEDYRAIRMAAHPGTRLARARTYLERHPKGVYAKEVNSIYESEEPAYFERAKASPDGARDYLASLPRGPHADAASAALREAYERGDEIALDRELRDGRIAEARFQRVRKARKAVAAAVLDALGALTDPELLGARLDAPPRSLVLAVHGDGGSLSGLPRESERDLFFTLPGATDRRDKDRVLTLRLVVEEREHRIRRLSVSGADWFVHWAEADATESLDPTVPADRAKGLSHALEVLSGALESRFPAARCAKVPTTTTKEAAPPIVLVRSCDGARVEVRSASVWGQDDVVSVEREPSIAP